jgi:hypothetical protein
MIQKENYILIFLLLLLEKTIINLLFTWDT